MKNARKLLPAIAMLLISAVMMSTASFAWFSMNTTVTANGMQISAKSDQTFLIISATKTTADEIQAEYIAKASDENAFTATTTVPTKAVYPAAVKGTPTTDDDLEFQYAVGTSYTDGTATKDEHGQKVYYDVTTLENYVVKYTFYITVTDGAIPAENIVVKSLTIDGDEAVHVVVTSDYAAKEYENGFTSEDATTILSGNTKITDTTVLAVNVYVFFDGDELNVTTANAATLAETKVTVVFGVKGATA